MRASGLLDEQPAIAAVAVLGLGFVVLSLGSSWFWVAGFVSVVPITAVLSEAIADSDSGGPWPQDEAEALEHLRERYAAGEIDESEFERRLETLLGTETIGAARGRVDDGRPSDRRRTEAERDRP